jgi:2,7-dihydroxy-5-methyl-1-naphthoate 7-O-methyltransferase
MSLPQARLDDLTDLATPLAIRVAATLRVADLIPSGVDSVPALARACGADPDALGRLLRFLVHRGVFTEPSDGVFALTDLGELLRERGAVGHRARLDLDGLGWRMDLAYAGLLHSVRTGEPAYAVVHGRPLWADLDQREEFRDYFDALMLSQQRFTAPQVADLYEWGSVGHVVDIAGGSGGLLIELLTRHPHLHGTLVDRPRPVYAAERAFAEHGLADRAQAMVGDFFAALPAGGDVYVISRALTDWGDRDAVAILGRCAEAASMGGGRVLVVEVLPSEPFVAHQTPYDLHMLAVVGGRERGIDDFATLAAAAGLAVRQALRGTGGLLLLELAPPT